MSSVTSFLRQIPTGLQYYTCPSGAQFYQFFPAAGNYTGNYPPGIMATLTLSPAFSPSSQILRDMGKTIRADISGGATGQFFREFQILTPSNTIPSSFGVTGDPNTPTPQASYFTVYLQITVAGVGVTTPSLVPIAGGQM
jgi:hypothetical protein